MCFCGRCFPETNASIGTPIEEKFAPVGKWAKLKVLYSPGRLTIFKWNSPKIRQYCEKRRKFWFSFPTMFSASFQINVNSKSCMIQCGIEVNFTFLFFICLRSFGGLFLR